MTPCLMKASPPPPKEDDDDDDDDNHPVKKYLVLEHIYCSTFLVCIFHQAQKCSFLTQLSIPTHAQLQYY